MTPITFLGVPESPVLTFLRKTGENVVQFGPDEPVGQTGGVLTIVHGYRRILRPPPERGINLHASYLPWNRGADPNLWSWIEGTPKGVAIHWIDAGVDTGDMIACRRVPLALTHTLRTSYERLQDELAILFYEVWPRIKDGSADRWPQPKNGTYHRREDRKKVAHLLRRGWDSPVSGLTP